jgi:hypothetical protein
MHVHNFLDASKIILLCLKLSSKIFIVFVLMATCGYILKLLSLDTSSEVQIATPKLL